MKQFCKIFGPDEDQILVKIGVAADGSDEVRMFFNVGDQLAEVGLGFKSYKKAVAAFKMFDEAKTKIHVEGIRASLR